MRRQHPVKGGRMKVGASVTRQIESAIRHTQRKFGISRSFVIAVGMAKFSHIREQENF